MDRPRRVLPVLVVVALVSLLLGAGYAAYELGSHHILPVFAGSYVRSRAVALAIAAFAAAYLAGVVLYAGRSPRAQRGDRPSPGRLVGVSVVAACGYALLSVLVEPRVVREYETIRRKSEEAAEHSRLARAAIAQGDWITARPHAEAYLAIDPTDHSWRRAVDEATFQVGRQTAPAPRPEPSPAPQRSAEPMARDLVERAREYFAREDYATAAVLAARAETIAPASREAGAVRRQAVDALARVGAGAAERAKSALYRIKEQGTAALEGGEPIRAYYIFKRGSQTYPQDDELLEFLGNAEKAVSRVAFFRDEVPDPEQVPRRDRLRRVAFVNRSEAGLVEIVYADSIARFPTTVVELRTRPDGSKESTRRDVVDVFLYGIEAMAFGGGRVVYHVRAPLGRLLREPKTAALAPRAVDRLVPSTSTRVPAAQVSLLALHRSVEADRLEPAFVAGTGRRFEGFGRPSGAEASGAGAGLLPLMIPVTTLWTLGLEAGSVRARDVVELWTLAHATANVAVRVELALRAIRPFMLLILGALAASVACRHTPAAALQAGTYLFTPAIAAAAHLAFALALHAARVAVVLLADGLGWTAGMSVLGASLVGLLVLALLRMDHALRRPR